MHALFKIAIWLIVVLILFGRPIMAFIRFLGRRSQKPPQRPSPPPRRPNKSKLRASEDIVDAEIIDFRKE